MLLEYSLYAPPFDVLYEDNHLIAVLKPANMLVQGDASGDTSLYDYIKDYLKLKYSKNGNVFLGIVHRLDRPVSGVMVFAKTSKAASRLSELIRNGKFEKTYYAVVSGILLEKAGRLENYLIKQTNKLGNVASVVFKDETASKLAQLRYRVLDEDVHRNLSLLHINLETGRFHQIRAQFANHGHPLYADAKYGYNMSLCKANDTIALFSQSISFKHPTQERIVKVDIPLPSSGIWNLFRRMQL